MIPRGFLIRSGVSPKVFLRGFWGSPKEKVVMHQAQSAFALAHLNSKTKQPNLRDFVPNPNQEHTCPGPVGEKGLINPSLRSGTPSSVSPRCSCGKPSYSKWERCCEECVVKDTMSDILTPEKAAQMITAPDTRKCRLCEREFDATYGGMLCDDCSRPTVDEL